MVWVGVERGMAEVDLRRRTRSKQNWEEMKQTEAERDNKYASTRSWGAIDKAEFTVFDSQSSAGKQLSMEMSFQWFSSSADGCLPLLFYAAKQLRSASAIEPQTSALETELDSPENTRKSSSND
jgi:hypothetical protein